MGSKNRVISSKKWLFASIVCIFMCIIGTAIQSVFLLLIPMPAFAYCYYKALDTDDFKPQ